MLSFVLKNTPLKMCWVPRYSDYYPEHLAAALAAVRSSPSRSMPKSSAPTSRAGAAYGKVPLNVVVMQQDYVRLNQLKRHPRGVVRSLKIGSARCGRKRPARISSAWPSPDRPLRIGLQEAGVPVKLNTALTDLYVETAWCGVYVRDAGASESAEPQLIALAAA